MIRRKPNKFESCRLTLEERITRLERVLTSNRKLRKFEGARPGTMMVICKQIESMIGNEMGVEDLEVVHAEPSKDNEHIIITFDDGDVYSSFELELDDGLFVITHDGDEVAECDTLDEAISVIIDIIDQDMEDL